MYDYLSYLFLLQRDYDDDGIGVGCDTDTDLDKDGVQEDTRGRKGYSFDNCPNLPNADQLDTDNDGFGEYTKLIGS